MPDIYSAIASALIEGLVMVVRNVAEKPVFDRIAERQQQAKTRQAVQDALASAGTPTHDEASLVAWITDTVKDRLQATGNHDLRLLLARAVLTFTDENTDPPQDLVDKLRWPASRRKELARLLVALRQKLASLDEWRAQIEYVDRERAHETRSDISTGLARIGTTVIDTPSGPALRVVDNSAKPATVSSIVSPFVVPFPRNPDFVGREADLERLHGAIIHGNGQPVGIRPTGLTGMGGIGKTQLAVEYVYRYQDHYSGGIFWLNAAASLTNELVENVAHVIQPAGTQRPLHEQLQEALAYLRAHPDSLLVLDNLDDPLTLNMPLSPGLVLTALPSRLLFTTRRRNFDRFTAIEVTVLPEEVALQLLLRHPSREPVLDPTHPEHAEAKLICSMLGYLPLALEIASAHLGRRVSASLVSYREALLARGVLPVLDDPRAQLRDEELPTRHRAAIEATLAEQWESLQNDSSRLLLRVAAQLPEAAPIPSARLGLLANVSDKGTEFFGSQLDEALQELEATSLIEELKEAQIRLHPLIREFAVRLTAAESRQEFRLWIADNLNKAYADIEVLETQCLRRGVEGLLGDLSTVVDLLPQQSVIPYSQRLLRLLQREARALRAWNQGEFPSLFTQQVHNRAVDMRLTSLLTATVARLASLKAPYLSLRWRAKCESDALEQTLVGHDGGILDIAVTQDGQRIISAASDGATKVWNLATGREEQALACQSGHVNGVAVTRNGQFVITGADDNTVTIWNLTTGTRVRRLHYHRSGVTAVAMTPNEKHLLSASRNGTVIMQDLLESREMRVLTGDGFPVWDLVVTPNGSQAVLAVGDGTVKIWNLATGLEEKTLIGHTGRVLGIAVTPDGRRALSSSEDGTVKVWNLATGKEENTLRGDDNWLFKVAVTPDGQHVLAASWSGRVLLWNLETGVEEGVLAGHGAKVNAVVVAPDGQHIITASHDRTIKIWDLTTQVETREKLGHNGVVNEVIFAPDGERGISCSNDTTVKIWNLARGVEEQTLRGHSGKVFSVAVTPDGQRIVSGAGDGTVKVRDVKAGSETTLYALKNSDRVLSVAVTPDGQRVLWGLANGAILMGDIDSDTDSNIHRMDINEVHTLGRHEAAIDKIAVLPSGKRAVTASGDGVVKVWNLETSTEDRTVNTMEQYDVGGFATSITSDGRHVISGSGIGHIKVWNLETGSVEQSLEGHGDIVFAAASSAGKDRVFTAGADGKVKVWDLSTGRETAEVVLEGSAHSVAVSPDGATVIAGDTFGNVYCFEYVEPRES